MKYIRFIFALAICCFLTGCAVTTVDQMYQLPKRSDDYNNLQSAIDSAMNGLAYCAPLSGENRQTVQMCDLDGDEEQEYLLFAKGTQEKPLRILVFQEIDGVFCNIATVECNGSAFDQVEYIDMDGNGGAEIIVGRQLSNQLIRSVSVYTFQNGELKEMGSSNYTNFLTTDLDGNGKAELFVLRPGMTEADNGIAELYRMQNGALERLNEAIMSQPADKLKRIIIGKLDGGKSAVFAASTVGDTALVTDVYAVQDGKLLNVTLSNETDTSVRTMRNFNVYADDLDNDSVVELPSLIEMKPLSGMMSGDMHHLIRWFAVTPNGDEVNKMYTYHNFVGGWYLQLNDQWAQRISVLHSGDEANIYLWDVSFEKPEKLLTVYAFSGENREEMGLSEGRFTLQKTESLVYAAQLCAYAEEIGLTQEDVVYSFRLIRQDWKTGET